MTLTAFLATYGALLSTAGLGWNFYRDFHDRAKLKVTLSLRAQVANHAGRTFVVAPSLVADSNPTVFGHMDITNTGRRPIYVEGVAGKWKTPVNNKDGFVIIPENHLPQQLSEGQSTYQLVPELDTFSDNLRSLYAYDSTGKKWKVSRKELRKVIADAHKYQTESRQEGM